jgi:hypothetical protein
MNMAHVACATVANGTSRHSLRRKIRSLSAHSGHYSGLARDGSVANNPKATSGAQKIE